MDLMPTRVAQQRQTCAGSNWAAYLGPTPVPILSLRGRDLGMLDGVAQDKKSIRKSNRKERKSLRELAAPVAKPITIAVDCVSLDLSSDIFDLPEPRTSSPVPFIPEKVVQSFLPDISEFDKLLTD
jgi:hypothetical protein